MFPFIFHLIFFCWARNITGQSTINNAYGLSITWQFTQFHFTQCHFTQPSILPNAILPKANLPNPKVTNFENYPISLIWL